MLCVDNAGPCAAAFDRIEHSHLLAQLGTFPARGRIEQWLKAGVLDQGRLQEGDDALAGTRHAAVARLSAATAAEVGVKGGDTLTVTGPAGTTTLPLLVTQMPDRVVWLPLNSTGGGVTSDTGARPGDLVRVGPAVSVAPAEATEVTS